MSVSGKGEVQLAGNVRIFGFVQFRQTVSTLTSSVWIASCKQPLPFALMASTSDIMRMRSTTVRNFCSGGSRMLACARRVSLEYLTARARKRPTSGSGHIGSPSLSTSAGFITSIRTSCATRTRCPTREKPLISKLSTACSFFFASLTVMSSDSWVVQERRVARRASEARAMVISLLALDWMR